MIGPAPAPNAWDLRLASGEPRALVRRGSATTVRPFLERIEKMGICTARLADFDAELERLNKAYAFYDDRLTVCFLGLAAWARAR